MTDETAPETPANPVPQAAPEVPPEKGFSLSGVAEGVFDGAFAVLDAASDVVLALDDWGLR